MTVTREQVDAAIDAYSVSVQQGSMKERQDDGAAVTALVDQVFALVGACVNAHEGCCELGSDPDVYEALKPFLPEGARQ